MCAYASCGAVPLTPRNAICMQRRYDAVQVFPDAPRDNGTIFPRFHVVWLRIARHETSTSRAYRGPATKHLLAARRLAMRNADVTAMRNLQRLFGLRSSMLSSIDHSDVSHLSLSTLFTCNCSLSTTDLCNTMKYTFVISCITQCFVKCSVFSLI
jgi:hypothetical protein